MPKPFRTKQIAIYTQKNDPLEVLGTISEEDVFWVWDEDGEPYLAYFNLFNERTKKPETWFVYYSPISQKDEPIYAPKYWAKSPTFEDIRRKS